MPRITDYLNHLKLDKENIKKGLTNSNITYTGADTLSDLVSKTDDIASKYFNVHPTSYIQGAEWVRNNFSKIALNGDFYIPDTWTSLSKFAAKISVQTAAPVIHSGSNITDVSHLYEDSKWNEIDISNIDFANVTNFRYMFQLVRPPSYSLNVIGFDKINTSKGTDFSYMFDQMYDYSFIDFSKLDLSNAINIERFIGATNFVFTAKQLEDINNLNLNNVENASGAFTPQLYNKTLDLSKWVLPKCKDISRFTYLGLKQGSTIYLNKLSPKVKRVLASYTFPYFEKCKIFINDLDFRNLGNSSNMFYQCKNNEITVRDDYAFNAVTQLTSGSGSSDNTVIIQDLKGININQIVLHSKYKIPTKISLEFVGGKSEQREVTYSVTGPAVITEDGYITLTNYNAGDKVIVTVTSKYDTTIVATKECTVLTDDKGYYVDLYDGQFIKNTSSSHNADYMSDAQTHSCTFGYSRIDYYIYGYTKFNLLISKDSYGNTDVFNLDEMNITIGNGTALADGERKTFEYTTDGSLHRLTVLVNKPNRGQYGSDRVYVKYTPIEEV